jgi:signal transduction histidine kinase
MSFAEEARITALQDYRVLDSPAEQAFDNITRLAARLFRMPIALVTLVDTERQWFKSRVGLSLSQTVREDSFCAHAIGGQEPLIVTDALADPRFVDNPLVVGEPRIRFYCGAPLRTPDGHGLGSLCVIDRAPRTLAAADIKMLVMLARQVEIELEIHRQLWLLKEEVEKQRQLEHSRGALIAMMIHDLRSPLTSLTLLGSFVETADEESREALQEMLMEAERMRRMLKDVLDICLHEVGQLRARRRQFELRAFSQALGRRLESLGRAQHKELELDLPDTPVMIDADPDLLERVFENLVTNALDHGPANHPISLRIGVTTEGLLRGTVRDRGTPIPDSLKSRIFGLFEHFRSPGTGRGHGLGLAFCRLAVEAHGGTIGVSENAEGGNCFHFELPLTREPAHASGFDDSPRE